MPSESTSRTGSIGTGRRTRPSSATRTTSSRRMGSPASTRRRSATLPSSTASRTRTCPRTVPSSSARRRPSAASSTPPIAWSSRCRWGSTSREASSRALAALTVQSTGFHSLRFGVFGVGRWPLREARVTGPTHWRTTTCSLEALATMTMKSITTQISTRDSGPVHLTMTSTAVTTCLKMMTRAMPMSPARASCAQARTRARKGTTVSVATVAPLKPRRPRSSRPCSTGPSYRAYNGRQRGTCVSTSRPRVARSITTRLSASRPSSSTRTASWSVSRSQNWCPHRVRSPRRPSRCTASPRPTSPRLRVTSRSSGSSGWSGS
mmetsp:Transcript_22348/g.69815  ORF Transcript_22348/g.69815 Transcript_22348/m.69815 type:complete len:321 (-) Transcript_22348:2760-3722(-)